MIIKLTDFPWHPAVFEACWQGKNEDKALTHAPALELQLLEGTVCQALLQSDSPCSQRTYVWAEAGSLCSSIRLDSFEDLCVFS